MATEATTTSKFQNPDFHHGFHPEISVPIPHDGLHFWQLMIAGSIAGSIEHMVLFPFDTIKTRMQALSSCPVKSVKLNHAFLSILRTEGPSAFFRGIAAMGIGAGPAHAVQFSVYEVFKKYFSYKLPDNYKCTAPAISGACATFASEAVFTPTDMVKQRLQLGSNTYKGVWDCVKMVLREEGIGAFYASYRTTVLMNIPFQVIYFAAYETTKGRFANNEPFAHAVAGGVAGALAAAVTTPLDVIKTQLQCQGVCGCARFKSGKIKDVFQAILKKDGYRGFTRGWIPRVIFHSPAAAICWPAYEASKAFFQALNGNSNSGIVT